VTGTEGPPSLRVRWSAVALDDLRLYTPADVAALREAALRPWEGAVSVLGSELAQRAPGSFRRYVTVGEPPLPDAVERHYALYFHQPAEPTDAPPRRGTIVEITGVAEVGGDRSLPFEHPADDLRLLWRAMNEEGLRLGGRTGGVLLRQAQDRANILQSQGLLAHDRDRGVLLPTPLGRALAAHTRLTEAERACLIALAHGTGLQAERTWVPPDGARRTLARVGQERGWRPDDGWRGLVLQGAAQVEREGFSLTVGGIALVERELPTVSRTMRLQQRVEEPERSGRGR
jgi:hypothetical protein